MERRRVLATLNAVESDLETVPAPENGFFRICVRKVAEASKCGWTRVYEHLRRCFVLFEYRHSHEPAPTEACFDVRAVGVFRHRRALVPWLAVDSSDPKSFAEALRFEAAGHPVLPEMVAVGAERVRNVFSLFEKVNEFFNQWAGKVADECPAARLAKLPKEYSIVCLKRNASAFYAGKDKQLPASLIPVDSGDIQRILAALWGLRKRYGQGWMSEASGLLSAFDDARKGDLRPHVFAHSMVWSRSLSASSRAALARNEFAAFGWLSWQKKQSSGGIHVLRDFRAYDAWGGELPFRDKKALCRARAFSLDGRHANDHVRLAFRLKDYHIGRGGADASEAGGWFILPSVPLNAWNTLMRLLPEIPWTVIAFEAGGSRSRLAGVLEEVLAAGARQESALTDALIGRQIEHILANGAVSLKRELSPFDACETLEEFADETMIREAFRMEDPEKTDSSQQEARTKALATSIAQLFHSADTDGPFRRIQRVSTVIYHLCRLPRHLLAKVIRGEMQSDAALSYQSLSEAEKFLKQAGRKQDGRSGERYPVSQLKMEMVHMWSWLFSGKLKVTPALGEWMRRRISFAAIVPVDCPEPAVRPHATVNSPRRIGEINACRYYSLLFCGTCGHGCMEVDVMPLLESARRAFLPGSLAQNSGWLAAKCSETNELIAMLMTRVGFVSDFPLGDLPSIIGKKNTWWKIMLQRIDSRLLVRAMRSTVAGERILGEWAGGLQGQLIKFLDDAALAGEETWWGQARSDLLKRVFFHRDPAGIAVAALDCARLCVHGSAGFSGQIFFRVGMLASLYFEPGGSPVFDCSSQTFGGAEKVKDVLNELVFSFETGNKFDAKKSVDKLEDWYAEVGQTRDETINVILDDIQGEIGAKITGESLRRATERIERVRELLRQKGWE